MEEVFDFLRKPYHISDKISFSLMDLIIMLVVLAIATILMRILLKLLTKNLPLDDKRKFNVVFGYARWLIRIYWENL